MTSNPKIKKNNVLQGFVLPYGPNLYWSKIPEYDLDLMKKWDTDFVRFKVEFKGDDNPEIDFPVRDFESLVKYCKEKNIKIMLYSEQVVPESIARKYPVIDANGKAYPRGHFSIVNFFAPEVRAAAIKAFGRMGTFAAENKQLVEYLQPCNEWVMKAYLIGWLRKIFGLVQQSYPGIPISYDENARVAWVSFLKLLPASWQDKIYQENGISSFEELDQIREYPDKEFSPTYLAYRRFLAQSMGGFFKELHDAVKEKHPELKIISSSYMPYGTVMSYPKLGVCLGHNVEYWLEAGRSFDYLSVNSYSNLSDGAASEFPYTHDNDLNFQLYYTTMSEIVRAYNLKGLVISEMGVFGSACSEDGQRYLLERGMIQAHVYGHPEAIAESWWNDGPDRTPTYEQFQGVVRDRNRECKPAFYGYWMAKKLIDNMPAVKDEPFTYIILSRKVLDMGRLPARTIGCPCVMAAREINFKVTTDNIIERAGFAEEAKSLFVFDSAQISSAAFAERLESFSGPSLIPATIGLDGIDDDNARAKAVKKLLGLKDIRIEERDILDFKITESFGCFKEQQSFSIPYRQKLVRIEKNDLSEEARILGHFSNGDVALYKYKNRFITAFAMDVADAELMANFSIPAARTLAHLSKTFKSVRCVQNDERVLVLNAGNAITVFNTDIKDKIVELATPIGRISLPVRRKDFSAVAFDECGRLTFALATAKGDISVDNKTIMTLGANGLTAVYSDGTLEVRPFYHDDGKLLVTVLANGAELERNDDELSPCYSGTCLLPLEVSAVREERVRAKATFIQEEKLSDGSSPVSEKFVSLQLRPNKVWLLCEKSDSVASVEFAWSHFREGAWANSGKITVELNGEITKIPVQGFDGCLESIKCRVTLFDKNGQAVKANAETKLVVEYADQFLPSMNYVEKRDLGVLEELVRIRLLYPTWFEACKIKSIDAQIWTEGSWVPMRTLCIGEKGHFGNHLQQSEFSEHCRL